MKPVFATSPILETIRICVHDQESSHQGKATSIGQEIALHPLLNQTWKKPILQGLLLYFLYKHHRTSFVEVDKCSLGPLTEGFCQQRLTFNGRLSTSNKWWRKAFCGISFSFTFDTCWLEFTGKKTSGNPGEQVNTWYCLVLPSSNISKINRLHTIRFSSFLVFFSMKIKVNPLEHSKNTETTICSRKQKPR